MEKDEVTTLYDIRAAVSELVEAKGWRSTHTSKNLSMAIVSEGTELMEPLLWASAQDAENYERSEEGHKHIVGEIGDLLIYIVCLANLLEIDLSSAILEKIQANYVRFPDKVE